MAHSRIVIDDLDYNDCPEINIQDMEFLTSKPDDVDTERGTNGDLSHYLYDTNSDEKNQANERILNLIDFLESKLKSESLPLSLLKCVEISQESPIALRLLHSLVNTGDAHLRKYYEILQKYYIEGEPKPEDLELEGIDIDDTEDWLDSEWTEIKETDIKNSKNYIRKVSKARMIGEETGFDSKVSTLLQRCDQTFTKYFEEDSRSPQESKVEQFISLCNETEELKSKLEEEEVDNQRLALKLNSLDNELSSLLVNHIGSSITQECEYVESSTEILKEKTSNCLNEADVVRNSVDDLTYGDTYKNILLKIKDSFTRKLSEHKIEKERLIVEIEEYDSNRLHLAPLLHQYSQIMAKTREIDRQVTQLMS